MKPDFYTDVCVIGGGPAGSVIAKRLAALHHNVFLAEKAVFPRTHVGICLSEPTHALLHYLGVQQEMEEAAFLPRRHTLVKWDTDEPVITLQPGMHVDRGTFDQVLLNSAGASGVNIMQEARCTSIQKLSTGGWKIDFECHQKKIVVHARLLADASGRSNMLPGKTIRFAPPLFALHTHWKLSAEPAYDGLMEAGENTWLWVARLPHQQAMISVYTDPQQLAKNRSGIEGMEAYYHQLLEQFSGLKHFHRAGVRGKITGCEASSRYSPEPVGNDFIRVGDACLSVDPMASQGVHLAISSGLQAAIVVNTLLRKPEDAQVAQSFYRNSQKTRIDMFRKRTAVEYARVAAYNPHAFWQDRAKGAPGIHQNTGTLPILPAHQTIQLSRDTQILPTPILQGDFVVSSLALHHPNLDQPVTFLDGTPIVPLLQKINAKLTVPEILASWSATIPQEFGQQMIDWLWQHGVLVAGEEYSSSYSN